MKIPARICIFSPEPGLIHGYVNIYGYAIMPHISKKALHSDVSRQIQKQFMKMLADKNTGVCDGAFGELLTGTEHMMLTKRFAAIVMLAEGMSAYRVKVILKISPATAAYLKESLDRGEYKRIAVLAGQKKQREQFWHDMESLLRMGMPEMGKSGWKWLDEMYPK